MKRIALCLALTLTLSHASWAQDTHYWNQRYGTTAEFLAGAVVGSPSGLSATFYNPGALAIDSKPQLFTTALAAEYNSLKYQPNINQDSSLGWSSVGGAPSLIAGSLARDTTKGRIYTYSYLTRQKFEFEITGRGIGQLDGLTPAPGDEFFSGQLNYRQKAEEDWGGITMARRLNPHLGAGVSLYGAYRSQRTRREFTAAQVDTSGQGATAISISDFSFWTARVLAKAGLFWTEGRWSAGVTYTSPSAHLFGDGSSYEHQSVTGLDLDSNGTIDATLLADYQQNLSPTYKSPMSAALGFSYHAGATDLYLSSEWFDKVNYYEVMSGAPVASQVPGDTVQSVLVHQAISLVNWAVGVGHRLNAKTALYAGWAIDRSAFTHDILRSVTISNWNIYHVSFGSEFTFSALQFTLGGTYSFGDNQIGSQGDMETASTSRGLASDPTLGRARYKRIKLILGFTLPIG